MEFKTISVIGANGTMGTNISAIFAAFGNAKVYTICRDMEKAKAVKAKAIQSVKADAIADNLISCDYSMLSECVSESDLVFESVSEHAETKIEVLRRVAEVLKDDAVICSGTSGLSLTDLENQLPDRVKGRFFGLHFFNPPYNMSLCEVIPTENTDEVLLEEVCKWTEKTLLRTIVKVKDKAAFLGNRIGFYCINMAMQYAQEFKEQGGIGYVDAVLGSYTGRAMAPLNTADFVGLDIHKAIVDNLYEHVNDYAKSAFELPAFVVKLIDQKKLGRKSGEGFYKSNKLADGKREFFVYDITTDSYVKSRKYEFAFKSAMIEELKSGNYEKSMEILVADNSVDAKLCVEFLLKYIVYSLYSAKTIGESCHDADDVMATGFNWAPPLAVIDAFGGKEIVWNLVKERLSEKMIQTSNAEALILESEKSRYDFRRYFRAKN